MAGSLNKNMKLSGFGGSFTGIGSGGGSGGSKIAGKVAAAHSALSPETEVHTVSGTGVAGSNSTVIPIIRNKDNAKQLPTYYAAMQRGSDEHLAAEDLDNIQLELETMLSSVALRARVLKLEYESIDKDEKRNDRRNKEKQPLSPAPGLIGNGNTSSVGASGLSVGSSLSGTTLNGKRKRDEPPSVRKKHSSMTILKQAHQQSKHAKNSPHTVHTDDSMDYMPAATVSGNNATQGSHPRSEYQLPKLSVPKNDMPNKFWLSVEPYCMPLTNEDLRLIDDLLEQYKGPLVPPIPPLGPHYSVTWANEDLKELQQSTSATSNRLKPHNSSSVSAGSNTGGQSSMLRKADAMLDESITGPLTQRLVSALIEEQMIAHPSEQAAVGEHSNSSSSENTHSTASAANTPCHNFRSLSLLKSCFGIENRVKKELMEQGILHKSDFPNNDEDEVLHEIKRISSEISSVALFNSGELKQLRVSAANEIKRLELKRKLDTIDQEILECYKRMLQNRAKRKGFTLDEQQEIYRLTSEQRSLAEQLERVQLQSQPYS